MYVVKMGAEYGLSRLLISVLLTTWCSHSVSGVLSKQGDINATSSINHNDNHNENEVVYRHSQPLLESIQKHEPLTINEASFIRSIRDIAVTTTDPKVTSSYNETSQTTSVTSTSPIDPSHDASNDDVEHGHETRMHLASWNFDHVKGPFIISVFLITAGIAKLGNFHFTYSRCFFYRVGYIFLSWDIYGDIFAHIHTFADNND